MALPKVDIQLQNGALGAVEEMSDGVAGIVVSGVAITGDNPWDIGEVKSFRSIDEVKAAGIDETYDTTNTTHAFRQIKEFYDEAGNGAKLYVIIVPKTETMANIANKAGTYHYAKVLLDAANGEIRFFGITRIPDTGYTPTYTSGLDDDVIAAVVNAQALCNDYAAKYTPTFCLIEGRDYQGDPDDLEDLRAASYNRVGVVICGTQEDTTASVGLVLGRLAKIPVQRKISRVKDGALLIAAAYCSDGETIESSDIESIHNLGYIAIRVFANKTGYYLTDDPLATAITDDYNCITNRRVIDKAVRIVYLTYINELNDDIDINADGTIPTPVCKYYQSIIANAVNNLMANEISSFTAVVDPKQNVISTSKVQIKCSIVPKGYTKTIEVLLGFSNPALSS